MGSVVSVTPSPSPPSSVRRPVNNHTCEKSSSSQSRSSLFPIHGLAPDFIPQDESSNSLDNSGKSTQKDEDDDPHNSRASSNRRGASEEDSTKSLLPHLFSTDFIHDATELAASPIECAIFFRFALKQHWKNLLFQDIKHHLMESTFHLLSSARLSQLSDAARKIELAETFPTQFSASSFKGILQYFRFQELQALFLASVLSCFFRYRDKLDFALDTSIQPASREELLNSLCIPKDDIMNEQYIDQQKLNYSFKKFLEEYGEDRIIDPEDVFVFVSMYSSSEELAYLLNTGLWSTLCSAAFEKLPYTITVWNSTYYIHQQEEIELNFPSLYCNKLEETCNVLSPLYSQDLSLVKAVPPEQRKIQVQRTKAELRYLQQYFRREGDSCIEPEPPLRLKHIQEFQHSVWSQIPLKMCLSPNLHSSPEGVTSSNGSLMGSNALSKAPFSENCPLFFAALSVERRNSSVVITIHCPLKTTLISDQLFLQIIDFLLFSMTGIVSR